RAAAQPRGIRHPRCAAPVPPVQRAPAAADAPLAAARRRVASPSACWRCELAAPAALVAAAGVCACTPRKRQKRSAGKRV
ncbi:MAG: hypothetical protein ACKO1E_02930, partial [Acidimicrobiaceae bacterium]